MRFLPALLTAAALLASVAAPASAALVSTTMNGVEIGSYHYNVTFWQDGGSTTFNDVFGTGNPSFIFTDETEAHDAAQIILNTANSIGFDVTPGNDQPDWRGFVLAFGSTDDGFDFFTGWLDGTNSHNGLFGPFYGFDRNGSNSLSFATLERADATPVPEPGSALLMGVALGAAALARRRRAA